MLLQHTDNANSASDDKLLLEDNEFSLLDEAEHAVANTAIPDSDDNEPYEVQDQYPNVQLAEGVLESLLSDDPDAASLADMLEDIQCQLETIKRRLEARTMELANKAKAEAIAKQQEEDESAILGAIEHPEYRSVLAAVVRLLDGGQAGPLLDVIQSNNTTAKSPKDQWQPDTATKLTTSLLPEVPTYAETVEQYASKPAPATNTNTLGWL